jgi:hypothetical protein
MPIWKTISLSCCAVLFCSVLSSSAKANDWNKKTIVTFSDSVEVPGAILPPGTYVFKLLDLSSIRNVVQIMSADEDFVFATVIAIPIERTEPADHTLFRFSERPADSPVALHTWFYPGETTGLEFIYPTYEYRFGAESQASSY